MLNGWGLFWEGHTLPLVYILGGLSDLLRMLQEGVRKARNEAPVARLEHIGSSALTEGVA